LNYIWRKRAGASWLHHRLGDLTSAGGGSLAVIERPDSKRVLLEICCQTETRARALLREFGGSAEPLRPDWLQYFVKRARRTPLQVGARLFVLDAPGRRRRSARSIIIPAEAAFGTGEHATTAMCLRLLERITRPRSPGWRMLDAGTGSGILAIAGRCFGAGHVLAIDNDPFACATAQRNARRNRVGHVKFVAGDILRTKMSGMKFDVITANLFSGILIAALSQWSRDLAPGGCIILSGILRTEEPTMRHALAKNGFVAAEIRRRGKWLALHAITAPSRGADHSKKS